jgi:hypothetical protein
MAATSAPFRYSNKHTLPRARRGRPDEHHRLEALSCPEHPWIAKNLPIIRESLDTVRKSIGEIVIDGSPENAEIRVNGKEIGHLLRSEPVRLSKGAVDIELRAPGYVSASKSLALHGGERARVSIALAKSPVAPTGAVAGSPKAPLVSPAAAAATRGPSHALPPSPAPTLGLVPASPTSPAPQPVPFPSPPRPEPAPEVRSIAPERGELPTGVAARRDDSQGRSRGSVLAWSAAVAAGLALGLGIAETAVWLDKRAEFDDREGTLPTTPPMLGRICGSDEPNYGGTGCKEIHDDMSRARTLAIVGYGLAGGFAVGSAVLFATLPAHRPKPDHAFTCTPASIRAGVICRFAF